MESPRHSDDETFVDGMSPHDSNNRLMEDFLVDDSTVKGPTEHVPLLYTPAYSRAYKRIRAARISIFVLNFLQAPIPIFGGNDTIIPLLPITLATMFFNFVPLILVAILDSSSKEKLDKEVGIDKSGSRRTAILVEDPVTGRERWMLEPKPKMGGLDKWVQKRSSVARIDIYCGAVFVTGLVLSLIYGQHASKAMWVVVFLKVLTLLLLVVTSSFRYKFMVVENEDWS